MWYLCPGGQTESNYTRTVLLMCVSCVPVPCLGSGFLRCHCRRALSCSIAACSGFFLAMVQTLPWLLISVSLGQPQPDPSVSTCCTASHVVLCRSRCLVFQSCPHGHGLPPCSTAKRKRREQKKKTEENKGNKKEQRKEKKTDLGEVEPPSSASQPEWLKKATPHP